MAKVAATIKGEDGIARCWWCGDDPEYVRYHDEEWGQPVSEDRRLFEKICLEGFQAGLSWITILRKRDAFRRAFANFEIESVARFGSKQVDQLVRNADIIRHRGKIESTINNANRALELRDQRGSLATFIWQFEPSRSRVIQSKKDIAATTPESTAMSKELKKLGWSFVGPTTCYAMMQSVGMVNDHLRRCDGWQRTENARTAFRRP